MRELISYGLIPTSSLTKEEGKYVSYCGNSPLSKMQVCTAKYFSKDFDALWEAQCKGRTECAKGFNLQSLVTKEAKAPEDEKACTADNTRFYIQYTCY